MARILLADDDAAAREIVERALLADGHTVLIAQDGSEALARLESGERFDVLVTDVHMPGLDGIALANSLVGMEPGARIVLLSGYPEQLDRGRAMITGGRLATLTKPVALNDLRGILRQLLA